MTGPGIGRLTKILVKPKIVKTSPERGKPLVLISYIKNTIQFIQGQVVTVCWLGAVVPVVSGS